MFMIFFWLDQQFLHCLSIFRPIIQQKRQGLQKYQCSACVYTYIKTNLKVSVLDFVYHTRCIYLYRSDWKNIMLIMSMILHSLSLRKNKRSCTSMYIIQVVVCDKTIGLQACPIIMTTQEHINFSLIRLSNILV